MIDLVQLNECSGEVYKNITLKTGICGDRSSSALAKSRKSDRALVRHCNNSKIVLVKKCEWQAFADAAAENDK
jgi:hypothetical protein